MCRKTVTPASIQGRQNRSTTVAAQGDFMKGPRLPGAGFFDIDGVAAADTGDTSGTACPADGVSMSRGRGRVGSELDST